MKDLKLEQGVDFGIDYFKKFKKRFKLNTKIVVIKDSLTKARINLETCYKNFTMITYY